MDTSQEKEKDVECRPSAAKRAKLDEAESSGKKCKLNLMLGKVLPITSNFPVCPNSLHNFLTFLTP